MIARLLYTAVVLCVIGAVPRSATHRASEDRPRTSAPAIGPSGAPAAGAPARYCQAGDRHGIGRNPPDFAIPRIDR